MSGISLHAAANAYMDALYEGGTPAGTLRVRRTVLYRLARRYRGRQYRGLKKPDIVTFLYGPKGILLQRAPNTCTSYRAALRHFFKYGESMGWGPAVEIPLPVIPPPRRRRESPPTRLPVPLLTQLLVSCGTDAFGRVLRGMLSVAMNTAWRVSDVQELKVGQIDLVTGNLRFVSRKTGKPDLFPLSLDLEDEIRDYMSWYSEATGIGWVDSDAYLFPGWARFSLGPAKGFRFDPDPQRPASYSWALRMLQAHFLECGIQVERREAWHVVRRSVARIYFDSLRHGGSYAHALKQTAALLQHDSTSDTERYLGLSAEIEARDESLRGKRFIGVRADAAVIPLHAAGRR